MRSSTSASALCFVHGPASWSSLYRASSTSTASIAGVLAQSSPAPSHAPPSLDRSLDAELDLAGLQRRSPPLAVPTASSTEPYAVPRSHPWMNSTGEASISLLAKLSSSGSAPRRTSCARQGQTRRPRLHPLAGAVLARTLLGLATRPTPRDPFAGALLPLPYSNTVRSPMSRSQHARQNAAACSTPICAAPAATSQSPLAVDDAPRAPRVRRKAQADGQHTRLESDAARYAR